MVFSMRQHLWEWRQLIYIACEFVGTVKYAHESFQSFENLHLKHDSEKWHVGSNRRSVTLSCPSAIPKIVLGFHWSDWKQNIITDRKKSPSFIAWVYFFHMN